MLCWDMRRNTKVHFAIIGLLCPDTLHVQEWRLQPERATSKRIGIYEPPRWFPASAVACGVLFAAVARG